MRDQDLISSHVGVTLKSKHGLPSRISVSDLQDALGDRTSTLYRLLTPIFSSIRGTSQYWYQVRTQLFAMVRMLGTPTWFVTITMNESCWTDLLCILLAQDTRAYNFNQGDDELLDEVITSVNKAVNLPEKKFMDWKRKLISERPLTVVQFFEEKVRDLINWNQNDPTVLGVCIDVLVRIEFQLRGNPHAVLDARCSRLRNCP